MTSKYIGREMDNRLLAEERHLAKTTPISFSRGINLYSVVSLFGSYNNTNLLIVLNNNNKKNLSHLLYSYQE